MAGSRVWLSSIGWSEVEGSMDSLEDFANWTSVPLPIVGLWNPSSTTFSESLESHKRDGTTYKVLNSLKHLSSASLHFFDSSWMVVG